MVPKTYLEKAPQTPGVYIFKDRLGKTLYVGKAKRLKERLSYYFQENLIFGKTKCLMQKARSLDFIQTVSEVDALILEADFIKNFRPQYNEALKDDKNYTYIRIGRGGGGSGGSFFTVSLVRKVTTDGADYFGPYPTGSSIRIVLKILRRLFGFRDCSPAKFRHFSKLNHGCLFYDLGLCPAPCAGSVSPTQYQNNITNLKKFLSVGSTRIEQDLTNQMEKFSKNLEFENASGIKNKLAMLAKLKGLKFSPREYAENPNLATDQRKKELKALIDYVNNFLPKEKLRNLPGFRIEAYDISNTSGKNSTASMITFVDGEISPGDYRKFKIRNLKGPNDYAMLEEVIKRRFKHESWPFPNLILVDGGLGQVKAAENSLPKELKITIIGLAKRLERPVVKGAYRTLAPLNPASNIIRHLRDESHRFAKAYHKLLRSKYALSA